MGEAVRGTDAQDHQGGHEGTHPSEAGHLLSALRGMIRWIIGESPLDEDDDRPRPGKAMASRETGGFVPWTEEEWIDDDVPAEVAARHRGPPDVRHPALHVPAAW
jgi:hypothetical protein